MASVQLKEAKEGPHCERHHLPIIVASDLWLYKSAITPKAFINRSHVQLATLCCARANGWLSDRRLCWLAGAVGHQAKESINHRYGCGNILKCAPLVSGPQNKQAEWAEDGSMLQPADINKL